MRVRHKYPRPQRWRGVDVRDSNGLLQHGLIVNIVDNGIIVDFNCTGRRSEMVEFGKAFRCEGCYFQPYNWDDPNAAFFRNSSGDTLNNIEALVQFTRQQPWTWYPAKILTFHVYWKEFVLVEVQVGNTASREVMPIWQIRVRPSKADMQKRAIEKGFIVSRTCDLPKEYGQGLIEHELWKQWKKTLEYNGQSSVYLVCLLGPTLVYLQCANESPMHSDQLQSALARASKELSESKQDQVLSIAPVGYDEHDQLQFSELSTDIVTGVFQRLDTINRVKYRRVCKQWHSLLTSNDTMADIHVSFMPNSYAGKAHHTFATCVLKGITAKTRWIIIADTKHNRHTDLLVECLSWIGIMSLWMKAKKYRIIIHKCKWDIDSLRRDVELLCRASRYIPYQTALVWKDCVYSMPGKLQDASLPIATRPIKFPSRNLETELCDVLEENLPEPAPLSVISQWFAQLVAAGKDALEKSEVSSIFSFYQALDPRTPLHMRDRYFDCSSDRRLLDVDLTKLSKLTVYALTHLMQSNQEGAGR